MHRGCCEPESSPHAIHFNVGIEAEVFKFQFHSKRHTIYNFLMICKNSDFETEISAL